MPKSSFLKLVIGVIIILTVGGIGLAGLSIWRDRLKTETQDEEIVAEEVSPGKDKAIIEQPSDTEPDVPEIDTSAWEAYRNEEFRFSFKYPPKANIEERSGRSWVDITIEISEYHLTFFAGTREIGGPYGYVKPIWKRVLNIGDTEVVLSANAYEEIDEITSETELFLSSNFICYEENKRYDHFSSFIALSNLQKNEREIIQIVKSLRYFGDRCT